MHFYWVILSLLFISNAVLLPTKNDWFDGDNKKSFPLKHRYIPGVEDDEMEDIGESDEDDLTREEVEELEFVFECSPKRAQLIVEHLKDPHYFPHNRDYRSAYFVGEPGSGKTSMARAIGYKMSKEGWNYVFVASTQLLGEYRNQTAIRLKEKLESAIKLRIPTIIIIDELNRLLENTESKHHDTDTAATTLWLFLDKQRNNENFFLIGTMNRVTKLPKPFKGRILIDIITFPKIEDAKTKNVIFRRSITSRNVAFDNEVTDEFLNAELGKLGPCVGRNLNKISKLLFQLQKMENKDSGMSHVVKKEIITQAVSLYRELQKETDYDFVEETDDERQNRYHMENMDLQKYHHRENQKLQEQHFVQQQFIQLISSQYKFDLIAFFGGGLQGEQIDGCLSNEQIQLIYNIAQEAHARKKQIKENNNKK